MNTPNRSSVRSGTISAEEFALLLGRAELRIMGICLAVGCLAWYRGSKDGWSGVASIMVAGAIASLIAGVTYGRQIGQGGVAGGLRAIIPYVFGCYLVAARGLWDLWKGLSSTSVVPWLASAACLYLGYRLVFWIWQLTELHGASRNGSVVAPSPDSL